MPASASPSVSLARTDLTSTSWLTGFPVMWSRSSSAWPSFPQGAVGTQVTNFTDDLSRSEKLWTSPGLSTGVASTITLVANVRGYDDCAASAQSMVGSSAV